MHRFFDDFFVQYLGVWVFVGVPGGRKWPKIEDMRPSGQVALILEDQKNGLMVKICSEGPQGGKVGKTWNGILRLEDVERAMVFIELPTDGA